MQCDRAPGPSQGFTIAGTGTAEHPQPPIGSPARKSPARVRLRWPA